MGQDKILLSVDVLNPHSLEGWCARRHGCSYSLNCLIIEIGKKTFLVDTFNFREDLRDANIGSGKWGFKVETEISTLEVVSIYDQETMRLLWTGNIFNPALGMNEIAIDVCQKIINPEQCLASVTQSAITAWGRDENTSPCIYRMSWHIHNSPVYYFQLAGEGEIIDNLKVVCKLPYTIQRQYACAIDNLRLYEYFVLPRDATAKLLKSVLCEVITSKKKLYLNIESMEEHKGDIYIFSNNGKCFIRPCETVNLSEKLSLIYPEINLDSLIYKPSIINYKSGVIKGSPAFIKYDKNAKITYRNVAYKMPFHYYKYDNTPKMNIPYSIHILQKKGINELIKRLYEYVLNRRPDPDGASGVEKYWEDISKNNTLPEAIERLWNLFLKSDEYKNIYFHPNSKFND